MEGSRRECVAQWLERNHPGVSQPHASLHHHLLAQDEFLNGLENHIARSCLAHNNHCRNRPSGLGFSLGQTESLSNSVTSLPAATLSHEWYQFPDWHRCL